MIRIFHIAAVCSLVFLPAGCKSTKKEEPVWEKVKIGDLAPHNPDKPPEPNQSHAGLKTFDFDVHVFEIPAENIDKLIKIRNNLFIRPLLLTDYSAFSGNSFFVRFGSGRDPGDLFNETISKILDAGSHKLTSVSLMMPDGEPETIVITGIEGPRTVFFVGQSGSKEGANVGPGILGLRIRADKVDDSSDVCKVVVYPVFSAQLQSAVPGLNERAKLREFPFNVAAFGLSMSPGDFVLLGPEKFLDDQTTLGSLVFSNPRGSMFLNAGEKKLPELKPAVRVFLFLCTRISG